jgi:hypothetical protein
VAKQTPVQSSSTVVSEPESVSPPIVSISSHSVDQEVLHELLNNFPKPTLKNLLLEHALIEKQEDNQIFLLILHKLAF